MFKTKSIVTVVAILLALALPAFARAQKNLPVLSSISPISTSAGVAVTITANGSNFTSGTLVLLNGVALTTTYMSATKLTAALASTQVAVSGTLKISVYTPGRFGGTSAALSFTVNPGTSSSGSTTTTTTPLAITTTSVPIGTTGVTYSALLGATGGTSPYAWSLAGGSLPPGLTMSSAGAIGGTPTTSGTFSFMASVKDAAAATKSYTYSATIAQGSSPLSISTASVPNGTAGTAYPATTLAASGGNGGPYTWSLASGAIPAGLTLAATGSLAGTPTTAASYSFGLQAKDSVGNSASKTFSMTVAAATTTTSGIVWQTGMESSDPGWDYINASPEVAINSNPSFVHSGAGSLQIHYHICGNPAAPPGLAQLAAGSLPQQAVYVKYTYVNAVGETGPSAEAAVTVAPNNVVTMASPPASTGMTAYNVYAATASGAEVRQNPTPIPIGTSWTGPLTGLVAASAAAPATGSAGTSGCGGASQDMNRWASKIINPAMNHFFVRGYLYLAQPQTGVPNSAQMQRKLIWLADSTTSNSNVQGNYQLIMSSWIGTASQLPEPSLVGQFNGGGACPAAQWQIYSVGGALTYNTWHSIELEIQLNTPGSADGIARVWVDGVQTYNNTAVNLRGTCSTPISFLGIGDQANRYNYIPVDEYRYWDDIAISGSYIP